jgi:hypothetical protein
MALPAHRSAVVQAFTDYHLYFCNFKTHGVVIERALAGSVLAATRSYSGRSPAASSCGFELCIDCLIKAKGDASCFHITSQGGASAHDVWHAWWRQAWLQVQSVDD